MKKSNFFVTLFTILAVCFISVTSYAFDLENKVIKTKLKNGLTVLMMERHLSPTVALYITHRVGSVDEYEGESGAAHFLEHMMFKGTTTLGTKDYKAEKKIMDEIEKTGSALDGEKRKGQTANAKMIGELSARLKTLQDKQKKFFIPNEVDRLYTQNGGLDMNASTGHDMTSYHVSIPANKIELWARIESDRLQNPVFREFYTERDVVMEERRQRVESDPEGKLYEQFISTAYKTHPYGRPVLGWEDDLANLSPASVKRIFDKYRAPDSIVIAIVGDIKPKDTLKIIEKYFGRIPANGHATVNENKNIVPPEPAQTEERRVEVLFDANPTMIMGFHKPNAPSYDDYVFDVLQTILSEGRTSRFYDKLVTQTGLAESVGAYNGLPGTRYPNLFTIFAQPRHPHGNADLEEAVLSEIEKIKNQPVTDAELTKAKNQLKMQHIRSLDSNGELASMLSYCELLMGSYKYASDYLKNIDKVTADDIQKAARLYLTKENRTVAVLNKKKD